MKDTTILDPLNTAFDDIDVQDLIPEDTPNNERNIQSTLEMDWRDIVGISKSEERTHTQTDSMVCLSGSIMSDTPSVNREPLKSGNVSHTHPSRELYKSGSIMSELTLNDKLNDRGSIVSELSLNDKLNDKNDFNDAYDLNDIMGLRGT